MRRPGRTLEESDRLTNLMEIRSRANPRYKELKQWLRAGAAAPVLLVEGTKLIREALAAGMVPRAVWTTAAVSESFQGQTYRIPADMYGAISPTRSGNAPLAVFDKSALQQGPPPRQGRLLLLDAVQEPGNAGALIRAAAAFGFDGVIYALPGCSPFHHACIRASAGTVFRVKHYPLAEIDLENWLSSNTLPIFGADGAGKYLQTIAWPRDLILAMGNEGHGLRPLVRNHLSDLVAIPIRKQVESLNVAGAAHIIMYAVAASHQP